MRYILIVFSFLILILSIRLVLFYKERPIYKVGQKVIFDYVLLNEPKISTYNQTFYINGIKIKTEKYLDLHYGEKIRLAGIIEKEKVISSNRQVSDKNVKEQLFINAPQIKIIKTADNPLLSLAYLIRQKVSSVFITYLNKNEASLLLGIVLGVKTNMDKEFYDALKSTGIMHIVVASGMNVSIVGSFLLGIFMLFLRRQFAVGLTVIGIFFYALLSGFNPPIIRAAVMAVFVFSAGILGRQNYMYVSLFLTGFLMLLLNPELITDIGFQLSFSSTLGIISLKPIMENIKTFKGTEKSVFFKEDFLTTTSAQIISLPILIVNFGSYPITSILVNILILWTIPVIMIFGSVASIASILLGALAAPFVYLCYPFLWLLKIIVIFFSTHFSSNLVVNSLPISLVIGYYLILLSVVLYFSKGLRHEN